VPLFGAGPLPQDWLPVRQADVGEHSRGLDRSSGSAQYGRDAGSQPQGGALRDAQEAGVMRTGASGKKRSFIRGLGLVDATMVVAGSMIGSGVFIVSADIARHVGCAGWLLVAWVVTGVLTVAAALAYGELSAMMPEAGGQYIFLREAYSPFWGFLYGWTLFLVIQSGTIAAVAVAFARYLGVLFPAISPTAWIVPPVNVSAGYAVSLSTQQLVGILLLLTLTFTNMQGLALGKLIQNVFTSVKVLSLAALIVLGVVFGANAGAITANFTSPWSPVGVNTITPDLTIIPATAASVGVFGVFVAFCVAQVGSLFSADGWNNITFAAGEVKDPRRTVPLAMAAGTAVVVVLYLLVNVSYLVTLPLDAIQHAPDDRVATAALETIFGAAGAGMMAVAIAVSTFGCSNGMILAGARVTYAMAHDGLFFRATGTLNRRHVPAVALILQGLWASLLILPRTRLYDASGVPLRDPVTGFQQYGNVYSNLLDYVVFAVLIFYVLTIVGLFVLRRTRPEAERPYRAAGYPFVPLLYIVISTLIAVTLLVFKTQTTWPGLAIVLSGIPAYALWRRFGAPVSGAEDP
jgi:basic amino acid/polyamine antiporter, APA family